jgi:hypothetical protein
MKLHKYEMETITNFTEDSTDTAEICTFNQRLKKHLARLAADHPEEVQLHPRQYADGSVRYIVPQKWLLNTLCKIREPRKATEAQRAAAAAAAAKGRASLAAGLGEK